ncbi:ATP-binding protein [Chitinophaga sp.]|uniref:ATP-binding protein n=1 Tax=Chitinophaga sp. TaxID=1869181 RepID=UPI0031D0FCFA
MRKSILWFIASLAIVFLLLVTLFFTGFRIHRQSAHRLLKATDTLLIEDPSAHLMDSALFTLNDAENNFRLYTVLYDRKYLQTFSTELGDVLSMVDTISHTLDGPEKRKKFGALIKEKEDIAGRIAQLKKTTDSMLTGSLSNDIIDKLLNSIPAYKVSQIKKEKVTIDTVDNVQAPEQKKAGFFKRLGKAWANKKDTLKAQISILVRTKDGKVIDKEKYDAMQLKKVVTDVNGYYKNLLKQQLTNRLKLNADESGMAGTNLAMMEELKGLLIALREHATAEGRAKKQSASAEVNRNTYKMISIVLMGLISLIACLVAIAAAIWLVRKNSALLRQQKLLAEENTRIRTDWMNNMSHEMRTPLNSVAGFTEQLSFTPLSPGQKTLVESIDSATNMLIQVVNDVLDFSRLEKDYISLSPQPFVLYQVFIEVINIMRVQAEKKKLEFNVSFEGDKNGQVNGDIFRFRQILLNLLSNAIKYTDKGGITVTASLTPEGENRNMFHFSVTDTGEGISPEAQQRLFERFYQATKNKSRGTGLGLAITRRLLLLQGGDISFSSELHKGSTFACFIPYERVTAPLMITNSPQDVEDATGTFMEGCYVLVVDDQEMNLLVLKMILTRWKCRFDMVADGESALEMFRSHTYDLVLLDQHLPGISGVEVMEQIRADKNPEKAGVTALVLTAAITAEDEAAFRKAGFNGWLLKPFRERDIYQAIMKEKASNRSMAVS